ncbi:hypothetical protein [Candidatus Stoquefichus sp. SB1]|uniref:hypothetical protein n=1 Tax=Candidatus Stoquefichus sp. SB1 TaxID=1658109 RepID=UPI00067EA491|nr:hypothetical protein [Candidatus Stoquefichus sp. SB1]
MALQGVCEIELRDEQGNVVQRTKDKNMVTNGMSNLVNIDDNMIMKLFNISTKLKHYNLSTPILQRLIGGVYLFSDIQEESVDNIIPNFAKIVGSCSLSTSDINNSHIGIWNVSESNVIYNDDGKIIGIKFVFDFATNKGNGTIRSVSLTTDVGANDLLNNNFCFDFFSGGSSSDPNLYNNYKFNRINPVEQIINNNQNYSSLSYKGYHINNKQAIITITKNFEIVVIHTIDTTSKSFILRKYKIKNEIHLNEVIVDDKLEYNNNYFTLLLEKSISYSDMIISNDNFDISRIVWSTYYYDNNIYFTNAYDKIIKVKKISLSTFDVVENLEQSFEQGGLNNGIPNSYARTIFVYKNYYVVSQFNSNELFVSLLFINRNNLTIHKKISYDLYNSSHKYKGIYTATMCSYIGDYLYIRHIYLPGTSGELSICKTTFVDSDLNIYEIDNSYDTNKFMPINQEYFKYPFMIGRSFSGDSVYASGKGNTMAVTPYIKFTIDNLATPVTKTASQTMKVIYTIKDAEQQ